jgi:flagellar FliL protein
MPAAAAAAAKAAEAPPADEIALPTRGKKKLMILIAIALAIVLVLGGGAIWFLKHRAAAAAATDEDGQPLAQAERQARPHAPPVFVALDPFVVNLADKDTERYAQIGITLELDDPKVADEMKVYMPAIRDAILMILAHKTSAELLERSGKEALAAEIMRESVRPMGIEVAAAPDRDGKPTRPAPSSADNPVRRVLFSSFIVQ